jgi:flagellar protein FliO/FliZ
METITLLGRVFVSLAVVLGIMWMLARRVRGGSRVRSGRLIDVLGRQQVGRGAAVAVVRVAESALIVGVTDTQVTVLAETDLATAQAIVGETESRSRTRGRPSHRITQTNRSAGGAHTVRAIRGTAPTPPGARAKMTAEVNPADARPNALAGSALSPATWKQTIESLRDLTARPD